MTTNTKAQIGDDVLVYANQHFDVIYRYEFEGHIVSIREESDGTIITTVLDCEDDAFDLEDHEFELLGE